MQNLKILSEGRKSTVLRFQLGSSFKNLTTFGGGLGAPGQVSNPNKVYNNNIASTTQLGNVINSSKKSNSTYGGGLTGGTDELTPGLGLPQALLGVGSAIASAVTAQGNVSQQQMQRADSIVDGVSSAVSVIPGFGQAVGAGLQLVNRLGGFLVKQPKWMKNYSTNQNVMSNAAAFGGVAAAAQDAESTKDTFNKSGLFGKLIGKRGRNQSRFEKATRSQLATQGVLDESTEAKENMLSSADMFNTRNLVSQSGIFNNWNRGGLLFGKKGLKFQPVIAKSGIKIKKKNRGKFTESAKKAGMGVQEFASHVLANKEDYSPTQVKRANFAKNASKWKHQKGGKIQNDETPTYQGGTLPEAKVTGKMPFWLEVQNVYKELKPISEFAKERLPSWGRYSGDLQSNKLQKQYSDYINDLVARDIINERITEVYNTREDRLAAYNNLSDKEREIVQASKYASEIEPLIRTKNTADMEEAQKKYGLSAFTDADKFAETTSSIGERFRLFPNENSIIDDINPILQIGNMASKLGSVPKNIKDGEYARAATSIAEPLAVGALLGVGLKPGSQGIKQFANRVVNPLADLNPIDGDAVKKALIRGRETFQKTADLPIGRRLKNATMSGIMQTEQRIGREITSMGMSDVTPFQVKKQIERQVNNLKPGRVIHGGSMSLDSHPIYLRELIKHVRNDADNFGVIRTGKMSGVNDLGFKSKYIRDALPTKVKEGMKKTFSEFDEFARSVNNNPNISPVEKMISIDDKNPMRKLSSEHGTGYLKLDNSSSWNSRNYEFRKNLAKHLNSKYIKPLNEETNLNFSGFRALTSPNNDMPLAVTDIIGYKKGNLKDYASRFLKKNTPRRKTGGLMVYKEGKTKKKPKTIMPAYHQTIVRSSIKKAKYGSLLLNGDSKTLVEQIKEAANKHQFGGSLSVAKVTGAKGGRPSTVKTTSNMANKPDINTETRPPSNRELTSQERSHWNNFVDFVDSKGYKGSEQLDQKDQNLSRQLWNEFSTANNINMQYDEFIPTVQHNISEYRNRAIDLIKSGKMGLSNFTREQLNSPDFDWNKNFMPGLSGIDGWAGSRTTSWKFPKDTVVSKSNPKQIITNNGSPVLNKTYQYRKEGGKLNVIVGGELHARKHNLKELDELSDISLTNKGVPVIVKEDGGKITQAAEVEREELILHLELTKKIEALMKEGTEEAAIAAGKLLTKELIDNIQDNAGVIEKIEKDEND